MAKPGAGPSKPALEEKVFNYIRNRELFAAGQGILAGVSGGRDSAALLDVLFRLRERLDIRLGVGHVHHGTRGEEADADEDLVRRLARDRGLYFHGERGRPDPDLIRRLGPEAALRELRRGLLRRIMETHGYTALALAHHMEDQAETVLMRVLRGTGLKGLSGMRPSEGMIRRPFLDVGRDEIDAYVQEREIPFRDDRTNLDLRYTRNRIRVGVMPLLRGLQPRLAERLGALARQCGEAEAVWTERMDKVWAALEATWEGDGAVFPQGAFHGLAPEVRRGVLARAYERIAGSRHGLARRALEGAADWTAAAASGSFSLAAGVRADVSCGMVRIGGAGPDETYRHLLAGEGEHDLAAAGWRVDLRAGPHAPAGDSAACFHQIRLPLIARSWRPGDRIRMPGGTKKIQDVFVDAKIPRWRRNRHLCLAAGDRILWLLGMARSAEACAAPSCGLTGLRIRVENRGSF